MILCCALLAGTTFAWFTDSASTGVNKIVAGNLDIEVEYKDGGEWKTIEGTDSLFSGNLWEPGHTEVVYLKLTNKGTLALNYKLLVYAAAETTGVNAAGSPFKLSEKLVYSLINQGVTPVTYTREEARAEAEGHGFTLGAYPATKTNVPSGAEEYMALVVYMPETVGNEANYLTGTTAPSIDLAIRLEATQAAVEFDSFDNQYDANADGMPDHPEFGLTPGTVETVNGGLPTIVGADGKETVKDTKTIDAGGIKVTYPAGVLTTDMAPSDKGENDVDAADAKQGWVYTGNESNRNISVDSEGNVLGVYDLTLPVSVDNEVFVKVEETIEANQTVLHVWHNGTELTKGALPSNAGVPENRDAGYYTYDYSTGLLTIWVLHSSEVSVEYKGLFAGGTGTEEDPYLISSAQHFANMFYAYDGNHFKLENDITVSSAYSAGGFKFATPYLWNGTFDGNNHTITVSDSRNNVNLFYLVQDATIKNLNVVLDYSMVVKCYNTVTFDHVNVSGGFTATGNEGAYVIYDFANTLNFTDCVADAEMSGRDNNAVFVGYVNWPQTSVGTLNFTRCENKGSLVCNYAAMFIGNPNAYNIVCNVVDCVNSGTIQATDTDQVFNYYYAVTSNCYNTFTINGTVYNDIADGRSHAPSCFEDTLVTNTGSAIQGPQNTGMTLTQNADGTFTISPATIAGKTVDHYTVYVGIYAALKAGGSNRNYVSETISTSVESMTTTLKNLKFVDDEWVAEHSNAVLGELAGNVTYTLDGETYYMLVTPETDTLHGDSKAPQMIYVVAYDANDKTLASAQLQGNIA